jgi:valine dehydrogenase (NAD+)
MTIVADCGEHEQVVFCRDRGSGLRAIIGIYSTALGPALGGTRFYPYVSEVEALADVLRLSKAMAYKAACAGLPLGGGKAVILGHPQRDKNAALLHAYGRFVQSLAGRYYTACDVGTDPADMDVIAAQSRFVTGRSRGRGGAGDSAELTSYGVFQAMRAAAEHSWGSAALHGRRVGVAGVGKVGRRLVGHLIEAGASVIVADVARCALDQIRDRHPEVEAADPDTLPGLPLDIYAPCALGGVLDEQAAATLQAAIVCGGANNQLAHPRVAALLHERGVLYIPDFVANAGGLIQVAAEVHGYDGLRAKRRAARIFYTTAQILATANDGGHSPTQVAEHLAEQRLTGNRDTIWLPGDPRAVGGSTDGAGLARR